MGIFYYCLNLSNKYFFKLSNLLVKLYKKIQRKISFLASNKNNYSFLINK